MNILTLEQYLETIPKLYSWYTHLKICRCHVIIPPQVLLLASLIQGALQLSTQPLGVLPTLVLGHPEQHSSSVGGW